MKFLKNQKGMSLIEIMVVLTVMSLIGLGTTSLIRNLMQIQKRARSTTNISTIRQNLQNTIKNDTAWVQTIANGPGTGPNQIGCLDDDPATPCNHSADIPAPLPNDIATYTAAVAAGRGPFDIYDASGNLFYQGSSAGEGFTLEGQPCNTFNNAGGNDNCPFRYQLTWFANCPNAVSPCIRPQVIVIAQFLNNPASKGDPIYRFDTVDMSFTIKRGERIRHEPFEITMEYNADPGGTGTCNGTEVRPLSRMVDAANNVTAFGGNQFTLGPGTYECSISANSLGGPTPAGFSIALQDTTNNRLFNVGSAVPAANATAIVSGQVNFDVSANSVFRLIQNCPIANPSAYALGIPIPFSGASYTSGGRGSVTTTISCNRSS